MYFDLFRFIESLNNIFNAVVKNLHEPVLRDLFGQLHPQVQPLGNKPHNAVGIKFNDEFKISPVDVFPFGNDHRKAPDAALQAALEVSEHVGSALGIVDVQGESAVIQKILENLKKEDRVVGYVTF